ncbi:hypothetical protein ACIOEX_25650 [Streptomyces sp. NPDC087850]|uniref:hypothetical protein n=1 Tax=Streptomyces sp. NPDC087850 TaxID=3365809 RepID=UPI00381E080D
MLAHDSRTLELCRYFGIPHRMLNTFTHGDGGAAFRARLDALEFPPSIEVWDGSDDGALRYRISRLREQLVENRVMADRHITGLTKANKDLQRQVVAMKKQLAATEKRVAGMEKRAVVRVGPAIRRRIRRVKPGGA